MELTETTAKLMQNQDRLMLRKGCGLEVRRKRMLCVCGFSGLIVVANTNEVAHTNVHRKLHLNARRIACGLMTSFNYNALVVSP